MTNKEKYKIFCEAESNMPIFMQWWWLDAVCAGKQWDVFIWEEEATEGAEIISEGEKTSCKVIAAMPYLLRKRSFIKYVLMPQQTQIGGVWIREDKRSDYFFLNELADDIALKLRELGIWYFYEQFPIGSPLPKLLRSRGFKIKERVTYRLDDLNDLDNVMNHFSKNKRRQLQKSLSLSVDMEMSIEDFYQFHDSCLQEQGKKISYAREFLMVLEKKAQRLGKCQIIRIKNTEGETAAAAFVVWDERTLYYLIPTYSVKFKDSGAGSLLVWESIKLARERGLQFDFEGSMIRGVASHYKQFGSEPVKYYSVERYYHPIFWFALLINRFR